jgi:hypothetical protein
VLKPQNSFIPRYWAYQKIKNLQDRILIEGETAALKENITKLALEFQFVTPYTSMILVIDTPTTSPTEKEAGGSDGDMYTIGFDDDDDASAPTTTGADKNTMENDGTTFSADTGLFRMIVGVGVVAVVIVITAIVITVYFVQKRRKT